MKGSIFAVLAAATVAAVSCKKEEPVSPAIVTSTVEIQLSNPTTKAFGATTAEPFEKDLHNVIVFVYKNGEDTCSLVREFTEFELKQQKAVFTIPYMKENTQYDFYAVANCSSSQLTNNTSTTTRITRTNLAKEFEGVDASAAESDYGALSEYNSNNFANVIGSAKRNLDADNMGFIMSGTASATTPLQGKNEPTQVKLALKRTVAKVAIQASLDADFYKDGKYPSSSTLKVTKASLKNLARSTALIANNNPTINLRANALTQIPNVVTPAGATYAQYQNLFYIYENGVADASYTVADANKPVLVLEAEFDFDGDPLTAGDQSKLTYNIKLAGEAAATGNGSSPETDAKLFGLFVRNGSYLINVSIKGLTENEVVASIEVKDWETLRVQNVQIGQ